MSRLRNVVAAVVCLVLSAPAAATAQTSLSDQMYNLFVQSVVLARTPGGGGVVAHTPVFANDPNVLATTDLVNQVSDQIRSEVSNFPLGSSSGGFTYAYDNSLGTFARTTQTFGPAFAERAVTAGRGKVSFGMNYIHSSYSSLDGDSLDNGDIKFNLLHQVIGSFVEGDVIQSALSMNLTSDTTAFLFNYGVTNGLDVGLAVPLVNVNMDLTYHATILDFATHTVSPTTHVFADGTKTEDFTSSGSATGIGDIVVRGKYAFGIHGAQGLAVGVDLRLPTGDEANMLGSGAVQTKVFLIASGVVKNRLSPHVNFGYTISSKSVSDEWNYVGGLEYGVNPRLTIVGDFVGRTITDSLRLSNITVPHTFQQGPTAATETTTLSTISFAEGSLTKLLGTIGAKVNVWRNLLVSGHVVFQMNGSGLKSTVSPAVGFDYTF